MSTTDSINLVFAERYHALLNEPANGSTCGRAWPVLCLNNVADPLCPPGHCLIPIFVLNNSADELCGLANLVVYLFTAACAKPGDDVAYCMVALFVDGGDAIVWSSAWFVGSGVRAGIVVQVFVSVVLGLAPLLVVWHPRCVGVPKFNSCVFVYLNNVVVHGLLEKSVVGLVWSLVAVRRTIRPEGPAAILRPRPCTVVMQWQYVPFVDLSVVQVGRIVVLVGSSSGVLG